ncbi:nitrous oxide reductase accessory protein NosL [Castellaniella caeni]|uniref:nitrous oxide reductase accessory protein NosL n=1 Tax=Castellaniella caeni TaxID=266123 RepID=UPI000A02B25D|nr:nitrous oxide reductase accessory protein NosL [Castellaniella caeni]
MTPSTHLITAARPSRGSQGPQTVRTASAAHPRPRWLAGLALGLSLLLGACGGADDRHTPPPAPQALTSQAVGHYCGMNLDEHVGPKGQILLRDESRAVWFSTIREVFAYTLLPEEPKTITAIYVQDMGRADAHGNPPADAWIDAHQAYFLIESRAVGGMGAPDALPFAQLDQAQAYQQQYGGRIVNFKTMPEDYVLRYLDPGAASTDTPSAPAPAGDPS